LKYAIGAEVVTNVVAWYRCSSCRSGTSLTDYRA
jgi:hypothetical protein